MQESNSITSRLSVPVAVVLEKRLVQGSFWSQPTWDLDSILTGEHLAVGSDSRDGVKTADSASGELFLWSGYSITLYRDACERNWHALIGDHPQVYVVCREDETDGSIEPAVVTLDYDEASAHSETDGLVLSADIPRELYQIMESFVLDNYKPTEFKKRKRKVGHRRTWAWLIPQTRHHLVETGINLTRAVRQVTIAGQVMIPSLVTGLVTRLSMRLRVGSVAGHVVSKQ